MANDMTRFAAPGERKVATRLVKALLGRNYEVSVNDGYETTVTRSTKQATILNALCSTGEDRLTAHTPEGRRVGSFLLIWGNDDDGSELIADHTDSDTCNALAAEANGENA